ncbi:MAG: cation transporter [Rhodospirillaceae bacterium]|jgi:Co/Zn/Cd efflux system component|nr:cation transporter [Rhodospirillaceae bacterium]MBT5034569.1 cation transporter [Rhodospirillaceae bacterium]MBT6221200.1 cation transporter [Rhodospirillaceae bacterium]MBT6364140.1 cation transporter [Rhodospirillaceae bacterium]MBT7770853.1 cation transporter [Rhodospirillales bacterium]
MSNQCCGADLKFDGMSASFKRALWIVIAINAVMFVIEMSAGFASSSQALKADALDFLGDTVTYGLSLYVIGMSVVVRARAALFKGASLAVMGLWVMGSTIYYTLHNSAPQAEIMSSIGALALVANLISVGILLKYRDGDSNVRSVWLCSRNDAIGNVAVILAAGGVWSTGTAWPDLIVAGIMASLFLWSAASIIRQARGEIIESRDLAGLSI